MGSAPAIAFNLAVTSSPLARWTRRGCWLESTPRLGQSVMMMMVIIRCSCALRARGEQRTEGARKRQSAREAERWRVGADEVGRLRTMTIGRGHARPPMRTAISKTQRTFNLQIRTSLAC